MSTLPLSGGNINGKPRGQSRDLVFQDGVVLALRVVGTDKA